MFRLSALLTRSYTQSLIIPRSPISTESIKSLVRTDYALIPLYGNSHPKVLADVFKEIKKIPKSYYGHIKPGPRLEILKDLSGFNDSTVYSLDSFLVSGSMFHPIHNLDIYKFLIAYDAIALYAIPKDILTYRMCKEYIIRNNGRDFGHVPEIYRSYELCKIAVKNYQTHIQYVPDVMKTAELCNHITNPALLQYIPNQNSELCIKLLSERPNYSIMEYINVDDEYVYKFAICLGQPIDKIEDFAMRRSMMVWAKLRDVHLKSFDTIDEVIEYLKGLDEWME